MIGIHFVSRGELRGRFGLLPFPEISQSDKKMGLGVLGQGGLPLAEFFEKVHSRSRLYPLVPESNEAVEDSLGVRVVAELSPSEPLIIARFGPGLSKGDRFFIGRVHRGPVAQTLECRPHQELDLRRAAARGRLAGFEVGRIGHRRFEILEGAAKIARVQKFLAAEKMGFDEDPVDLSPPSQT